jgi:hypothetical protein
MSTGIAPFDRQTHPGPLEQTGSTPRSRRSGRRARWAERRRLKRQDALSSRLAELRLIRALLGQAAEVVEGGWVQGAWFTVATAGGVRPVTAYDLGVVVDQPVTGACLVGAVVQAAGGPAEARSQLVQRTLDVTWHALREDPGRPVRWGPGPCVRTMHVLELTFWNDAPSRTQREVVDLLLAARRTVDEQEDLCRSEQDELGVTAGSAR